MLTSGGKTGDLQRCKELGIQAHLIKPVKQSELLDAIVSAVGRPAIKADLPREAIEEQDDLPSLRVLLAEDGKANQTLAVGLLAKWGHTVEIAENGEDTIALWQSGSFNVILMDVQMPVLDGLSATRRLRAGDSPNRDAPLVVLSASARAEDQESGLTAGADGYLTKPIDFSDLARMMARCHGGREAMRDAA